MKLIPLLCFLALNIINVGCTRENIKSKVNCYGSRSANSIVIVEGRTKLIYDKKLDKDCGSI